MGWDSASQGEPELVEMARARVEVLDDAVLIGLFGLTADALEEGEISTAAQHLRRLRDQLSSR